MSDFTGDDQLRNGLKRLGFTIGLDQLPFVENKCNWIAYRRTQGIVGKPVQTMIRLFSCSDWESAEVDLTGDVHGRCFKLSYSLSPDQLIAQLPEIEADLVAAWNALQM